MWRGHSTSGLHGFKAFEQLGRGRELCERSASDFDDHFAILIAQLVGGIQSLAHLRRDIRRSLAHSLLGLRHPVERHVVDEFGGQRQQHGDLRGHGHRGEFRLLEAGADSPSVLDDLARVFIQTGAEPGKGLKFFKLRVGEFEVARHRPVSCPLRFAANARNGFADIANAAAMSPIPTPAGDATSGDAGFTCSSTPIITDTAIAASSFPFPIPNLRHVLAVLVDVLLVLDQLVLELLLQVGAVVAGLRHLSPTA
jgi:hypothetical protein